MNPLIDELKGRGSLYQADTLICEVSYQIEVYQQFKPTKPGQPPAPRLQRIDCYIDGLIDFYPLVGKELTLHLEDGRCLDCIVKDIGGTFETSGGIYKT